jgi:hypothetical protein
VSERIAGRGVVKVSVAVPDAGRVADETTITVVHLDTGQVLSTDLIDPNRNYWRNTMNAPDRWPK